MVKRLVPIGNSQGIILDKAILELMHVDEKTPLELSLEGERLVISPVRDGHAARVRASSKKMIGVHRKTLKKLSE